MKICFSLKANKKLLFVNIYLNKLVFSMNYIIAPMIKIISKSNSKAMMFVTFKNTK